MNDSLFYWLGQIGLLLGAFSCIGVVHLTGQQATRPPWYYYPAIWLTGAFCAIVLVEPVLYGPVDTMTYSAYMLRLAIGIEHLCVFLYYRFRVGPQLPPRVIQRTNVGIGLAMGVTIVAGMGYGLWAGMLQNRSETQKLQQAFSAAAKNPVPAQIQAMQVKIDTLSSRLTLRDKTIRQLTTQLQSANIQLASLVELVVEMRSSINNLKKGQSFINRGVNSVPSIERDKPEVAPALPPFTLPPAESRKQRRKRLRNNHSGTLSPVTADTLALDKNNEPR